MLISVLLCYDQTPQESNLKYERFILVHGFIGVVGPS